MHGIRRCYLAPTLFALFATLWQPSCLAADEAIVSRIEAMEAGFPVQVLGNRLMAHQALSAFMAPTDTSEYGNQPSFAGN